MNSLNNKAWAGKTDGTPWMHRTLIALLKGIDVRVFYAIMAIIVPFYMIFNRKGYRSTKSFFQKRGEVGIRCLLHIYLNHFRFGQIIIDRFAVYAGKHFDFESDGKDNIDNKMELPQGFIMMSSHVGNWELVGCMLNSKYKKINLLVYGGEKSAITENRNRLLGNHNMELVSVSDDMSHIFKMNAAIDNGEVVNIAADRLFGSPKHIDCPFLGATAPFPMGPFAFATQKKVDAFAVFMMKTSAKKYKLIVRPLAAGDACVIANAYARELESIVNEYPYQWFNYFDFWHQS